MPGLSTVMSALRRALPWVLLFAGVFMVSRHVRPQGAFAPGERLPALTGTLADGSALRLQGPPREVLVLNFWASYCAPCRAEAPLLSRLQARGVRVIGVSVEEHDAARAARAASGLGMRYAIAATTRGELARFHVRTVPTTYVLAPDGTIVLSRVGAVNERELTAAVAEAKRRG